MWASLIQGAVAAAAAGYKQVQELKAARAEFRMRQVLDVMASSGCTLDEARVAVDVADALQMSIQPPIYLGKPIV